METLYTQPWHSHSMLTLHFFDCCNNYSDKLLLQLLQCCTSWDNSLNFCPSRFSVKWQEMMLRKWTRREDGGLFFCFFFVKQAIFRCSKDQWIRSKVKNTIPQTVKSIHYLVRQPSHCVLSIAVCSCGCSY